MGERAHDTALDDAVLPWLQEPLAQALRQRAHALLIHGPEGVGQFELGLALARASLCEAPAGEARPCGRCAGCQLMRTRAHPDFLLLVPDALRVALGWTEDGDGAEGGKGRAPSREIRVDAVRQAIGWAHRTPSRGGGKLLLIHPAQAMNAVTANALLKTLEEPPPSLTLVLCTADPDLLLPTIRSRCQRLRLGLPPAPVALAWLHERGVEGAEMLLGAAGGQPLEALALRGEGVSARRWAELPRRLARGDATALDGFSVPRVVQTLQKLCHDAMACAVGGAPRYFPPAALPPPGSMQRLAAWSRSLAQRARHDEHPWQVPLLLHAVALEAQHALAPASAAAASLDTLAAP